MIAIVYYSTVILILIYLICVFLYISSLIISALFGAPYVKTKKKLWQNMFKDAHLTKKSRFVEIGSGSGELTSYVTKEYRCNAVGLEINWLLHILSKLRKALLRQNNVEFHLINALDYDYSKATHVYIYMLPPFIKKLTPKLLKECKKGTVIVSYAFCLASCKKYLILKKNLNPFPIYYYKL